MNDRLFKVEPWGTAYTTDRKGNLQDLARTETYELNVDGLLGATKKLSDNFTIDAAIGANMRKNGLEKVRVAGGPFILPYLYTISNVQNVNTNPNDNYAFQRKQVNSAYYTVDFSFKNFLTLGTTGRYDAYSTLPSNARSIFTPSVSASLIFSELVNIPELNFGKFRASWRIPVVSWVIRTRQACTIHLTVRSMVFLQERTARPCKWSAETIHFN